MMEGEGKRIITCSGRLEGRRARRGKSIEGWKVGRLKRVREEKKAREFTLILFFLVFFSGGV